MTTSESPEVAQAAQSNKRKMSIVDGALDDVIIVS